MASETNPTNEAEPYDYVDWKMNHGIRFLRIVLFELGYDDEPDEVLLEVLHIANKETEAIISDLDDAYGLIDAHRQIEYSDWKERTANRLARIATRRMRTYRTSENE